MVRGTGITNYCKKCKLYILMLNNEISLGMAPENKYLGIRWCFSYPMTNNNNEPLLENDHSG